MASNASKASDWHKVSGFSGVVTLGKAPTFDEVYGAGFVPMIVAHDRAVQKIPSPTRIAFESVLFGQSGDVKSSMPLPPTPPDEKPNIVDEEHARLLAEAKITLDIESVTDFQSLVPVAHSIALSKGWWEGGVEKRPIEEIVANYHAEVSEAWEEYRAGRMATWYATGSAKPEGFWVEIADLLIRIADAIGASREHTTAHTRRVGFVIDIVSKIGPGTTESGFITGLHDCISNCEGAVRVCESFAASKRVDIYAIVREKLRYNLSRPYRHGGKKA